VDAASQRKARGAFFTPTDLAEFLADWSVRSPKDHILEPSCGEASLLLAAGRKLKALGGKTVLEGLDVHEPSIEAAKSILRENGLRAQLRVANFFDEPAAPRFDVVIGNPPYIRYQSFTGKDRAKAQRAALAQGVRLTGLANAWAAFVVHASSLLRKGGRLALVLPAALLSVNYAAPVRRFLLERFASVRLVMFEERVFPEVLEEVILLLAEGEGGTSQFDLFQLRDVEELLALKPASQEHSRPWTPTDADDKWTEALLPAEAARIYGDLTNGVIFDELSDWGEIDLGMVTGNNDFFTLTKADVARLGLKKAELMRISPPGSRHLRGLAFTESVFREMAEDDARVYLFYPDKAKPSDAAQRYIREGEKLKVHEAYKCAVRSPWWRVPAVRVPDLFFTYMNHDMPRLVANEAKAAHLNSVHGVTLKPARLDLGAELLPIAMLNSVTKLGAELVGRSYGGGILKVEPKEAARLPIPSPATLKMAAPALRDLGARFTSHVRKGALEAMVRAVDEVLLGAGFSLDNSKMATLAKACQGMTARRAARAGKGG